MRGFGNRPLAGWLAAVAIALGVHLLAGVAQADTVTTPGYVRELRLDTSGTIYLLVRLESSGGTLLDLCTGASSGNRDYGVYRGTTVDLRDGYRQMLQAALLSGLQVQITVTSSSGECHITRVVLLSP